MHDRFNVEPLDLAFTCTKWEGYCIKISQTEPFIKHHIIANIYKPPYEGSEDFDVFLREFNDFVNLLQISLYQHGYATPVARLLITFILMKLIAMTIHFYQSHIRSSSYFYYYIYQI